jgi:tRNA-dihydrouridine synthase A
MMIIPALCTRRLTAVTICRMRDPQLNDPDRRLCVAPMMDWTDRHCRYFHRLLAPSAVLYTEMVTTGAILHGDRERLLGFDPQESPLALQLGGSDPADLAQCARVARDWGYDEVNLNVGCPSDRVQKGRFGAYLMLEPGLVRDCVQAMIEAVDIPVTVKTRLGVDECDSYAYFSDFVQRIAATGCSDFIIHARKAWLSGLSPKENRELPELRYEWVYRIKRERPDLVIVLNGGIRSVGEARAHMQHVDGVMIGRAAYQNPWLLAELQQAVFGGRRISDRESAVLAMSDYLGRQIRKGVPAKKISRHMLGLFQGRPGAKYWRRYLSENAHLSADNERLLIEAMETVQTVAARGGDEPESRAAANR